MKQTTVTLASEPCMMIDVVFADSHQNLLSKGLDPISKNVLQANITCCNRAMTFTDSLTKSAFQEVGGGGQRHLVEASKIS